MIKQLTLKNFTAFTDLTLYFSPGINIVIGENGTGKTQLLKAILALNGQEGQEGQHYSSHASMDAAATHEANPALKDTHHETHS